MRDFAQVDVFTDRPGHGNPVAVVLEADGLGDAEMARFAAWTNLSETTFVFPPAAAGADYRVRIFTPALELPFAGHPTLGTCRALLDAGRLRSGDHWVQECGAGLVDVRGDAGGVLGFRAPEAVLTPAAVDAAGLAGALGGLCPSDPVVVEVGPRWLTGRVDVTRLDHLVVDQGAYLGALAPGGTTDVTLYAVDDAGVVHVRSFFHDGQVVVEDPVCGSGNAAVAAHLRHTGALAQVATGTPAAYLARQGRHRGRDGRIRVTVAEDGIWVAGQAVTVVTGTVAF